MRIPSELAISQDVGHDFITFNSSQCKNDGVFLLSILPYNHKNTLDTFDIPWIRRSTQQSHWPTGIGFTYIHHFDATNGSFMVSA